jgi:general secretion pathway protein J
MHKRASGFTLVEVLVALVIMAVLAGMAWQGVDGMARAKATTEQHVEQTLRLNTVLAQWEQDLLAVVDNPQLQVPRMGFGGAGLRLVRRNQGGVQLVDWALRDGRWMRWSGPIVSNAAALQESWLRSQQLIGNEPGQLVTLDGVTQVQMYCYRGNSWSNCQSSGDVIAVAPVASGASGVPQQQTEALPTGIRLVLSFAGALNGNLTRDTMLVVGQAP